MELVIKGKTHNLPMFLPDATHLSVKTVDSKELEEAGIRGVVVNTYHALIDNSVELVHKAEGLGNFMNFNGLTITDSGGFQAMSLVRKNSKLGKLTDDGVQFKNHKNGSLLNLTPELCIETQYKLGADIFMVLDDCTDPSDSYSVQEKSVNRTVVWAKRCKVKFDELHKNLKDKPLLFAIVQGGNHKELRKKCAEELIKIGFDGYAYGGWPVLEHKLMDEILNYTASLMPNDKTKYAMGVGKPEDIIKCMKMGYNLFDCVLPTRDARHGRVYNYDGNAIETVYLMREKNKNNLSPISSNCTCYACQNFSISYIRQLLRVGEPTGAKLATIHNLHTYTRLTAA